jgi:hypothetical protein
VTRAERLARILGDLDVRGISAVLSAEDATWLRGYLPALEEVVDHEAAAYAQVTRDHLAAYLVAHRWGPRGRSILDRGDRWSHGYHEATLDDRLSPEGVRAVVAGLAAIERRSPLRVLMEVLATGDGADAPSRGEGR